jgi:serine/threonine protein kinase/tetratricopeptide (TPR) repeat protein
VTVSPSDFVTRRAAAADARGGELAALVERLAEDMGRRWRAGERPAAEEYLAGHPEVGDQPEAALELIAEEIYLRAEAGLDLTAADFLRRFPRWLRQVQALLDCHQVMSSVLGPPRFPEAGEVLGDFRLLAELGRGGHARVFLATQPALADRPVVLKLAAAAGHEHLSLSRLQHTHVVPLHSVHDFPERGLRGLCQPYFGGAALADLLRLLDDVSPGRRSGADFVRALERARSGSPAAVPVKGPACQFLARASYVQAVCWVGACLADALHYAHERGLLHLDLKPSNVLLAADGQPMLLDFHLAHPPLAAGSPAPSGLGGTPGYMAPEHQAALAAVAGHYNLPAAVDGRADVYALGVLLYGALGGAVPVPAERPGPDLRRRNPRVSPGLADLLARCLAADPASRYPGAGALAADLRRHLADLPLRGVANRSPAERWRKWRRRRPSALPLLGLLLTGFLAAGLGFVHVARQTRAAAAALSQGQDDLAQHRYADAEETFRAGSALAEDLPFAGDLRRQLRDGADRAERGQVGGDLHALAERVRPLYGADFLPAEEARAVAGQCRTLWEKRELIVGRLGQQPDPDLDQQVQADLLDLAVLWANLRVRLAPPAEAPLARKEALDVLAQAEALFGPSCVLYRERQTLARALGLADGVAARQSLAPAPRNAWEHYALGRAYLEAGELRRADEELDRALELEPQGLWPNFTKGVCAYRLGQYDDALVHFTACVTLAPRSAACVYNRGRAYAELGRLDRALQDYDRALRLEPTLAAAALGRAGVHRRQKRYDDALADLDLALRDGADGAVVCYQQALVHLARQDKGAAAASLANVLRLDPGHAEARELLGRLQPGR